MIVVKNRLTDEQLNTIRILSKKCGIMEETAKILWTRGVDTEQKIRRFLSPGKKHFVPAENLLGIREATERIKTARDNGESVVIYGDYDVDGICATAIMYFALKEYGIEAPTVIPERADGYGLSEDLINEVLDEYFPDLIITVDCGISGAKEVEYLKNLGVDVIITDHHELPEILPDCITVNCKIKRNESDFDSLSGAGVVFKLATALIGKRAESLLDFCAVATVADSMPLVGENRDIVFEGLKLLNGSNVRPSFSALITASGAKEINAGAISFSLAPRLNAAGRMGNAVAALKLLKSTDKTEIDELCLKLNEYNASRQTECENLYRKAKEKLLVKSCLGRVNIIEGEDWSNGLVGIVASNIVDDYNKPAILLVNKNGILHGSARSVNEINILEALISVKDCLLEYGGHSQAAGVSLSVEKLTEFEARMNKFISEKYDDSVFVSKIEIEYYIDETFSLEFARELDMLEPFGIGNKRPLFCIDAERINPRPLKPNSPHLSFGTSALDMLYFNSIKYTDLLKAPVLKHIVFEPNINCYYNRESLRGYVRRFEIEVADNEELEIRLFRQKLTSIREEPNKKAEYITSEKIQQLLETGINERYGTLIIASRPSVVEKFPIVESLPKGLYNSSFTNLSINIVYGFSNDGYGEYRKIIYLDKPLYTVEAVEGKEIYINNDLTCYDDALNLDVSREAFKQAFLEIRNLNGASVSDSVELYEKSAKTIINNQFIFATEVFSELKIISFDNGKMSYDPTVKSDLKQSKIYNGIVKLQCLNS